MPGGIPVDVVENDRLRLAFLPTVGGRLISLRVDGTELLWHNPEYLDADLATVRPRDTWDPLDGSMGSWANVGGSKTWPAPQGWGGQEEWPGPPDAILDSGSWDIETTWSTARSELTVRLTSPPDPRTGLEVVREFFVPASGTTFRQLNTFRNSSARSIRWSVWEVCQVDTSSFVADADADAGIWVGVGGDTEPLSMIEALGRIETGPAVAGRRRVPVADVVAKVGFTDASGSLELRRPDGAVVSWAFEPTDGDYPDGGCQVELWMQFPTDAPLDGLGGLHPSAHLVELEVLSPLVELAPGAETTLCLVWEVRAPR